MQLISRSQNHFSEWYSTMLGNGNQFIPSEKASSASRIERQPLASLRSAVLSLSLSLCLFLSLSLFLTLFRSHYMPISSSLSILNYHWLNSTRVLLTIGATCHTSTSFRFHMIFAAESFARLGRCTYTVYLYQSCCAIMERWSQLSVKIVCRNTIDKFIIVEHFLHASNIRNCFLFLRKVDHYK